MAARTADSAAFGRRNDLGVSDGLYPDEGYDLIFRV
jgi:hypothetical protein